MTKDIHAIRRRRTAVRRQVLFGRGSVVLGHRTVRNALSDRRTKGRAGHLIVRQRAERNDGLRDIGLRLAAPGLLRLLQRLAGACG